MMLDQPGTGRRVRGELYEPDDARLRAIDMMESIGQPGNLRIGVDLEPLNGGQIVSAWPTSNGSLAVPVHSELLEDYQDRHSSQPWRRSV
jgi:gamma-glutamylaminecyclotransferase